MKILNVRQGFACNSMCVVTIAMLLSTLAGCPAPNDEVEEALEAEGYEDVELGGPALLVCSRSEGYSRTFTATRDGRRIEGAVCCTGVIFGGCTVRH